MYRNNELNKQKDVVFLASLCLALSAIEYLIPKPLPFVRLGIANIPLVLALYKFNFKDYLLLILLKVLCQAFIGGTFFSYIFIFSVFGTFSSALCMLLVYKILKNHVSALGLSVVGGLANNLIQLLLSEFFLFKESVKYVAPILLTCGFITSIIIGFIVNYIVQKSKWFDCFFSQNIPELVLNDKTDDVLLDNQNKSKKTSSENQSTVIKAKVLFLITIVILIWFVFCKNIYVIVVSTVFFYIVLCIKNKINNKKMPKIFVPLLLFVAVILSSLLQPFGKVLYSIGIFNITQGALELGIKRGCVVIGTVFLSKIGVSKELKFKGKLGLMTSKIFYYFEKLMSIKKAVKSKNAFADIDLQLLQIYLCD